VCLLLNYYFMILLILLILNYLLFILNLLTLLEDALEIHAGMTGPLAVLKLLFCLITIIITCGPQYLFRTAAGLRP
jgi:hypothetical protein